MKKENVALIIIEKDKGQAKLIWAHNFKGGDIWKEEGEGRFLKPCPPRKKEFISTKVHEGSTKTGKRGKAFRFFRKRSKKASTERDYVDWEKKEGGRETKKRKLEARKKGVRNVRDLHYSCPLRRGEGREIATVDSYRKEEKNNNRIRGRGENEVMTKTSFIVGRDPRVAWEGKESIRGECGRGSLEKAVMRKEESKGSRRVRTEKEVGDTAQLGRGWGD